MTKLLSRQGEETPFLPPSLVGAGLGGPGRSFPSLWPFLPWAQVNVSIKEALGAAHTGHGCLLRLCLKDDVNRKASLDQV